SGHSGIRLQEPCLDRSSSWPDPPMDGDRCGSLRWRAPSRCAGQENTASEVWADTAYRSAKNEEMLAKRGFVSRLHRKKPKGRPLPERIRIANARKSKVRSAVEHVFAHQKGLMGLIIRTIGLARARVKIGL